jgi:DNA-binding GntR family transcriptional regulator
MQRFVIRYNAKGTLISMSNPLQTITERIGSVDPQEIRKLFSTTSYMEQARQIIKRLILNGTYRPGERVKEAEIARAMGVSRSPVREAVVHLANEGLIKLNPQKGAFVRDFDLREVRELYEVREAVEVQAVRLAAARAGEEDLAGLREFLDTVETALQDLGSSTDGLRGRTPTDPYPLDLDYHREVAMLSKNERLTHYVMEVNTQLYLAKLKATAPPGRAREAHEEHLAIYQAIGSGDPDAAAEAMKLNVRNSLRNLERSMGEIGTGEV